MVGVFGVFATLSAIDFKMMGVGLATAVLIDATIVRAVLLPATMKLLGDWNWYLPRWLEWLPRIEPETELAPLRIGIAREDGRVRVKVAGELDLATVGQLREALAKVEDGDTELVLDLCELDFLDSVGIGELMSAQQRARSAGRHMVLIKSASTPIAQVLASTGVDADIEVRSAN
jgi:RND superfamily putative drug exporter